MKIKSLKIKNYKAFKETETLEFCSGFNIIVGENNIGKSALLRALSGPQNYMPHRNLTQPRGAILDPRSTFDFSYHYAYRDVFSMVMQRPASMGLTIKMMDTINAGQFIQANIKPENLENFVFSISEDHHGTEGARKTIPHEINTKNFYKSDGSFNGLISLFPTETKDALKLNAGGGGGLLFDHMANFIQGYKYRFEAERMNVGQSQLFPEKNLLGNAQNLATCLNFLLSSNFSLFSELCKNLNYILPNVHSISVPPKDANTVEIRVWPCDPNTQRDDLTLSLNECGTGIGQVLSILYVAMVSDGPKVIVIDEPNSFLHPGAAKKLIEVLSHYSRHQFIISTHSAEIIKAANTNSIKFLKQEKGVTHIEEVDSKSMADMRTILAGIGSNLSDVFGYDKIMWVEGETEELCFPLVMRKFSIPENGVAICSVIHTGDFLQKNKKDKQKIFSLYRKVSSAKALLPPAVSIVLDKEDLSDKDIEDTIRESKGLVKFLPRKMYENYLLDVGAIEFALNLLPAFEKTKVNREQLVQSLDSEMSKESNKNNIHAAKILMKIFSDISGDLETYDKVRDSVRMTEWLLANNDLQFKELSEFIVNSLSAA